ncbi:hypothetical protein Nepgr_033287 [Nepenthes gracilis]|uniref:Pentatricopeptide repeat-containing protein n=1 Tax=Nepenthes gracilis TaxID=150966 RepID=A0AAD3TLS4_NEPGR|nr:hypothetical protein Nepgr_033287 [Nepenthes gracilis]
MSENFLLRTFKELRWQPLKALECFRWVGKNLDYEHNSVTYNGIARVLAQCDSIREFWSVVTEMRTQGHEMDIDTHIKISRNFQKCRFMKDAVELYEFMMDGPFEPSDQDCILLLKTISVDPDLDLVFRVVKKYEAAGHTLSKAVYDGIHRSLTSIGRFDEAQKIVEAMENLGYEPDNFTYSQVVFGLCKASDEACTVLDEMEARGCLPDIKTWTILIKGHCAAYQIEKALSCFAKMMRKNLDVDADLLDVLINGFLIQKKLHGAYTLLAEMVDKSRLRPWQATYKLLIERLLELRRLEEALNLLHMMKKHNYPPFAEPFVQYISKYGTVDDAREFLNALSVREYASGAAYLHVLRSFFNEGWHSEATDLFYKSPPHIRTHKEISNLFGSTKNHRTPA